MRLLSLIFTATFVFALLMVTGCELNKFDSTSNSINDSGIGGGLVVGDDEPEDPQEPQEPEDAGLGQQKSPCTSASARKLSFLPGASQIKSNFPRHM